MAARLRCLLHGERGHHERGRSGTSLDEPHDPERLCACVGGLRVGPRRECQSLLDGKLDMLDNPPGKR